MMRHVLHQRQPQLVNSMGKLRPPFFPSRGTESEANKSKPRTSPSLSLLLVANTTSRRGMIPGSEQHVANRKPVAIRKTARVAAGIAYTPCLHRYGKTQMK